MSGAIPYIEEKTISVTDVLNSIKEIIYVADVNGNVVSLYGNPFLKNGINSDNYLNRIITEVFEKDENRIHTSSHRRCINGESFMYEWELNIDSKTYFFQTSLSPIVNSQSEISGITGIIRNISREKALNRFHREIELMFRTLTNAAKSAIISVNENSEIEYCNPATEHLFDYDKNELLGQNFQVLFFKGSESFVSGKSDSTNYDEKILNANNTELIGLKKTGEKIPIECSSSTYEILNIRHRVIIIQDISERKLVEKQRNSYQQKLEKKNKEIAEALEYSTKMQNQLVQSEKMASLGALISGIAHEINNPLAFVASNLNRFQEYFTDLFDLLARWKNLQESIAQSNLFNKELEDINSFEKKIDYEFIVSDCKELLKHNFEGIERIKNIVMQLRGFSHISENNAVEADINRAIEETLTIVWNELKYKATVTKNYGDIPLVQCHLGEIKQVFVNLLVNAAQAIEKKGTITIETYKENTNVIIKISDTGIGMNQELKRKIFDPFFTTKEVGKGTGLGLWISMSLIQKHNGNIAVESEEGKGTTIKIILPIETEIEEEIQA
jgi:two-component system, NtrC family, sensor kinase